VIGQFLAAYDLRLYCRTGVMQSLLQKVSFYLCLRPMKIKGEFIYAVTAAEGIILSLFTSNEPLQQ